MSATDRFLRQATRGLWGQKRREVQLELRGAIEDKVYRHQLCGLSSQDAERAALRDLGRPGAIARDLSRVHSAPAALRGALALGVAGLLSLQAAAQVGTVQAILDPRMAPACTLEELYVQLVPGATAATAQRLQATPAGRAQVQASVLGRVSPEHAAYLRRTLAGPGGEAALADACRQSKGPRYAANLLRLSDVYAALRAAGVTVTPLQDERQVALTFAGESPAQVLDLSYQTQQVGTETYVNGAALVYALKQSVTVPMHLTGLRNPVLTVGPAKLQLGSPETPVLATDLYARVMYDLLAPHLPGQPGTTLAVTPATLTPDPAGHHLRVQAPDGNLYATLSNAWLVQPSAASPRLYSLAVSSVEHGLLPAPLAQGQDIGFERVVSTLPELLFATQQGQRALLVYRLSGTDLHELTFTPVPAAQLRVNTAP
ncbi:permease prefix domain 1-containing protein [Deinococcus multiflagellatus]|uniref:Permease prefix domain 1-containing protein n=1 Tax=Deinococcus multiflagellatus TaxID=1656887 RepID=A0ABW1ZNZ5_9DEIO|nr:permease prefix domain 1-containing protein [Deinococcus multiflagellatus]MBZ9714823.1 permease prefix domain 1-containing protein [Deinococcus multiflagellatus]